MTVRKKKADLQKVGRKEKYNKYSHPKIIQYLASQGKTNEEICDIIGITSRTLYDWYKKYPELSQSRKHGADQIDDKVEESLYKMTQGYDTTETHKEVSIGEDNKPIPGQTKVKEVKKHIAPSFPATSLWLRNRRPDKWRDKTETVHTGAVGSYEVPLTDDDESHIKKQLVHLFPKKKKK